MPEAWAPFGWVPVPDTDPTDGTYRLEYQWADPHVNVISHAPDEVARDGEGLRCDQMYRHDTHTQVAAGAQRPLGDRRRPRRRRPVDRRPASTPFGPFASRSSTPWCCTVAPGTGARSPSATSPVLLFNVQGLGYAQDNASADLGLPGRAARGRRG